MKRIRTLGIALVAAMALTCSMGAPSASASGPVSEFVSGAAPNQVFGVGHATLGLHGGPKQCSQITMSGVLLQASSPELEASFSTNCSLTSNGCKLIFRPGAEVVSSPESGTFEGSIDIGPPGCGPMSMSSGLFDKCTATIPAQTGLDATFINTGEGAVQIEASDQRLEYTTSGPSLWGCASKTFTTGVFQASFETFGTYDFQVVGQPSGIYLSGEKSEEKAAQPRFEAEGYPTTFSGEEVVGELPTFSVHGKAATTKCSQAWFSGVLTGATAQLPVDAVYDQCKTGTLPATVRPEGPCQLTLNVLNAGPPYVGSAGLGCGLGEEIEVLTYASLKAQQEDKVLCKAVIAAQSNVAGVSYSNTGAGSERGILVKANLKGMQYTVTANSVVCPLPTGTYSDGAYTVTTTLNG